MVNRVAAKLKKKNRIESFDFAQQTLHPLWIGRTGGNAEAEGDGDPSNDGGLEGSAGLGVGGQLGEGKQ